MGEIAKTPWSFSKLLGSTTLVYVVVSTHTKSGYCIYNRAQLLMYPWCTQVTVTMDGWKDCLYSHQFVCLVASSQRCYTIFSAVKHMRMIATTFHSVMVFGVIDTNVALIHSLQVHTGAVA